MKNNLFRNLLVLVILVFVVFLVINYKDQNLSNTSNLNSQEEKSFVYINDIQIKIENADTLEKQTLGLSGRSSLAEGEGMIFTFEKPDVYKFWMKDMNFPIDIIWIGEDMKVSYIKENATPESYPEAFGPETNTKYVVEVSSGFVNRNNIKVGDNLYFSLTQ